MNVIDYFMLKNNLAEVVTQVSEKKYLLVSKTGKITLALVDVEFFEDLMALTNKKYLANIKKAREEYKKGLYYTREEVLTELNNS